MSTAEEAKAQATAATSAEPDLLDVIVKQTKPIDDRERARNRTYIDEFVRKVVKPGQVVSKDVETNIKFWIKEIDQKLTAQVNEILHQPEFQKLEGTWRGLHYLVHQSETSTTLKIKVLNVSKKDLAKDLERAPEFDQSALFKKVYEEEYGILGGKPYGLLVGDYEFSRTSEDVGLLQRIAQVAASAHAPFVSAASPQMFGFESYTELNKPRDLAKIFESVEYAPWVSFRQSEDSRYTALTLPRVLGRLPYGAKFKPVEEFNFEEAVDGQHHDKYLWMNAAWAYAARCTEAFAKDGWFGRTRGVEGGGRVEGLPVHTFKDEEGGTSMKCPTEIGIPDRREFELSNLGFLPLLHCQGRDFAAFLGAQTCNKPKEYDKDDATANAELSAKLNYLLCVSRFAHYLKVMARDKIGKYMEVKDCERWLNRWINEYTVAPTPGLAEEIKAKKPLAAARVDVRENPRKPGWYEAIAYLRPHFQLETLTTSMRLVAEVPPPPK